MIIRASTELDLDVTPQQSENITVADIELFVGGPDSCLRPAGGWVWSWNTDLMNFKTMNLYAYLHNIIIFMHYTQMEG